MNDLKPEKRQQLKIGVILIAIIFIAIYSVVMYIKYFSNTAQSKTVKINDQVIFQQPKLKFFELQQTLNEYPDRITIHYPYLVIVRPEEFRSEIYNMDTKRKEKQIAEVLLDYDGMNMIDNKQSNTYFNKIDLELLCDQAFIKSQTEILCITRPDQSSQENKLIVINPETLAEKDVYESQNVLTAVYFAKDTLYVGEYDFTQNKAYITINGESAPIGDLVNIIYPMKDSMYASSFKSLRNNKIESYYEIQMLDGKVLSKQVEKGEIVFK